MITLPPFLLFVVGFSTFDFLAWAEGHAGVDAYDSVLQFIVHQFSILSPAASLGKSELGPWPRHQKIQHVIIFLEGLSVKLILAFRISIERLSRDALAHLLAVFLRFLEMERHLKSECFHAGFLDEKILFQGGRIQKRYSWLKVVLSMR